MACHRNKDFTLLTYYINSVLIKNKTITKSPTAKEKIESKYKDIIKE